MDIFTTQLTRVVPVPIKPANLKVKALVKDARTGKLKEDLDHLENHDYYFDDKKSDKEENNNSEESVDKEASIVKEADANEQLNGVSEDDNGISQSEDGVKHLDLYV